MLAWRSLHISSKAVCSLSYRRVADVSGEGFRSSICPLLFLAALPEFTQGVQRRLHRGSLCRVGLKQVH